MESSGSPYIIINSSTKTVVDYTLWDGNTETWTPPSGLDCIGVSTSLSVSIGSTYNSGGVGIGTTSGNKWIISDDYDPVPPIDSR